MRYSVLIVDDNAAIRRALRCCIGRTSGWQVCGEAENGKIAVEEVRRLRPDVVILDFQMPIMNGLEAAREIRVLSPNTAMAMCTMHRSDDLVKNAHAAGIACVVSKSDQVGDRLVEWLASIQTFEIEEDAS